MVQRQGEADMLYHCVTRLPGMRLGQPSADLGVKCAI